MKKPAVSFRVNALLARKTWGEISKTAMRGLKELTSTYSLSVAAGDLQILDGKWYVTHSGLLRIAQRGRCMGINTVLLKQLSNPRGRSLGVQGNGLQKFFFSRVRRLRRCRSLQRLSSRPRRRDARCRNPCRQSRSPQSLRNRPLLCRGAGMGFPDRRNRQPLRAIRTVLTVPTVPTAGMARTARMAQMAAQPAPRPALPSDPPVQPRSDTRQGIRRSLLRHRNPQRRQPRIGRVLHFPPVVLGERRHRRPDLQTQFLFAALRR